MKYFNQQMSIFLYFILFLSSILSSPQGKNKIKNCFIPKKNWQVGDASKENHFQINLQSTSYCDEVSFEYASSQKPGKKSRPDSFLFFNLVANKKYYLAIKRQKKSSQERNSQETLSFQPKGKILGIKAKNITINVAHSLYTSFLSDERGTFETSLNVIGNATFILTIKKF